MDDFKIIFRQKRVSRHQCSSFEFQRFIGVNWIFQMTNDDSLKLILWLPFSRRVIECIQGVLGATVTCLRDCTPSHTL